MEPTGRTKKVGRDAKESREPPLLWSNATLKTQIKWRLTRHVSNINIDPTAMAEQASSQQNNHTTRSGPKIPAAGHLEGEIFWDLWLH